MSVDIRSFVGVNFIVVYFSLCITFEVRTLVPDFSLDQPIDLSCGPCIEIGVDVVSEVRGRMTTDFVWKLFLVTNKEIKRKNKTMISTPYYLLSYFRHQFL